MHSNILASPPTLSHIINRVLPKRNLHSAVVSDWLRAKVPNLFSRIKTEHQRIHRATKASSEAMHHPCPPMHLLINSTTLLKTESEEEISSLTHTLIDTYHSLTSHSLTSLTVSHHTPYSTKYAYPYKYTRLLRAKRMSVSDSHPHDTFHSHHRPPTMYTFSSLPVAQVTAESKEVLVQLFNGFLLQYIINPSPLVQLPNHWLWCCTLGLGEWRSFQRCWMCVWGYVWVCWYRYGCAGVCVGVYMCLCVLSMHIVCL